MRSFACLQCPGLQSRTLLSLRNQGGLTIAKPWKTVQPYVVDPIIFFTHSGPWLCSAMESSWPNDIVQVLLLYTTVLVQQCDYNLEKRFAATAGSKWNIVYFSAGAFCCCCCCYCCCHAPDWTLFIINYCLVNIVRKSYLQRLTSVKMYAKRNEEIKIQC